MKVGAFIGLLGATRQVTGVHLHFEIEIKVDGQIVEPYARRRANAV